MCIRDRLNAVPPVVINVMNVLGGILPAQIGEYIISPYGKSLGEKIGVIRAYVR